jgi:hypothetical protein
MGRMSFTQELRSLAKASEGMDASGCWREVLHLHRELGRAAWMMRDGQRGEWRMVFRGRRRRRFARGGGHSREATPSTTRRR